MIVGGLILVLHNHVADTVQYKDKADAAAAKEHQILAAHELEGDAAYGCDHHVQIACPAPCLQTNVFVALVIHFNVVFFLIFGITLVANAADEEYWDFSGGNSTSNEMIINLMPYEGYVIPIPSTRGDVNNNGRVNITDVTILIDYLLSGNSTGVDLDAADCDLDVSDQLPVVRRMVKT